MAKNFTAMKKWRTSSASLLVLFLVLFVIVIVLVLPQVDLLDTAFHLGTAPIVVHSQLTAKPVSKVIRIVFSLLSCASAITFLCLHPFTDNNLPEVTAVLNRMLRC